MMGIPQDYPFAFVLPPTTRIASSAHANGPSHAAGPSTYQAAQQQHAQQLPQHYQPHHQQQQQQHPQHQHHNTAFLTEYGGGSSSAGRDGGSGSSIYGRSGRPASGAHISSSHAPSSLRQIQPSSSGSAPLALGGNASLEPMAHARAYTDGSGAQSIQTAQSFHTPPPTKVGLYAGSQQLAPPQQQQQHNFFPQQQQQQHQEMLHKQDSWLRSSQQQEILPQTPSALAFGAAVAAAAAAAATTKAATPSHHNARPTSYEQASHSHSSSSSRPKRPSTGRIANFFASLVCYIWFAAGLPDTSPLATPSYSPVLAHAPLFPSPLAPHRRRSQRDLPHLGPSAIAKGKERAGASSIIIGGSGNSQSMAVAGASSLLPTDDFADRLSAAMERVSVALAGAEADSAATSDVDAVASSSAGLHHQGHYGHTTTAGMSGYRDGGADPRGVSQASLRMRPSSRFVSFSENLLTTTQVSSSVILLALLYIYRLKSRHPELHGQEGSEYRLSVTSLMLANKWLDDHTYLNKTWSELSGIELKDVTKMEREFWSGLGMDISCSDAEFQVWLKQVENMTARREVKIQRRANDIRARQLQIRRARNLSWAGSSSPSRKLPSRHQASLAGRRAEPEEEADTWLGRQNSPSRPWQPEAGSAELFQPGAFHTHRRHSHALSDARETPSSQVDMVGSRRLPPLGPIADASNGWDRSVPRRLFDSRPSSASSGGSFATMHQSFKGLSAHSPQTLGQHPREHDVSPYRSNKRFAADPDWATENPFALPPASISVHAAQHHSAAMSQVPQLPLPNRYNSPSRYRGPRSIPAHEVHQGSSNGFFGYGSQAQHPSNQADSLGANDYYDYAEALVAPFTSYDAALASSSTDRAAPSLAYYEVRSGPYRSMQSVGEPAPFVSHHSAQDGWETLRQAAQYFTPTSSMGYVQVSPDARYENHGHGSYHYPQQQQHYAGATGLESYAAGNSHSYHSAVPGDSAQYGQAVHGQARSSSRPSTMMSQSTATVDPYSVGPDEYPEQVNAFGNVPLPRSTYGSAAAGVVHPHLAQPSESREVAMHVQRAYHPTGTGTGAIPADPRQQTPSSAAMMGYYVDWPLTQLDPTMAHDTRQ